MHRTDVRTNRRSNMAKGLTMALAAPFPAAAVRRQPRVRPSRRPAPDRLRLTRRGRLVVGAIIAGWLLIVVSVASGLATADAGSASAMSGSATGVVVIQPGESLWQIAQQIAPGADPRETVLRIRELNGLSDAPVVPGQSLVVPAASADR